MDCFVVQEGQTDDHGGRAAGGRSTPAGQSVHGGRPGNGRRAERRPRANVRDDHSWHEVRPHHWQRWRDHQKHSGNKRRIGAVVLNTIHLLTTGDSRCENDTDPRAPGRRDVAQAIAHHWRTGKGK